MVDARYDFGRNWAELAAQFDEQHLRHACANLSRLVGDLEGQSFLDIGCGSGLHSAAALKLGAERVYALDYDTKCVETTRAVCERFAPGGEWTVERGDALNPASLPDGKFDVVYSWGVLHHTGDMWSAIRNAAACVKPGGRFCVALYLKTPLCGAWQVEKRIYAQNGWLRPFIKWPYVAAFLAGSSMLGRPSISRLRNYKQTRGMEFLVDVDDWLGGYPYESVLPEELEAFVGKMGFRTRERFNVRPGRGFFGTGCGEWRFENRT
jgi:2-polyprenyl-6-hydroxyphenyl methylase/3-demethylubiquinone-9 3-methyltransferase